MMSGPYARIAVLQPRDGDTVDFEAGYSRHLEWHRQVNDPWRWFGWTIWAGERQRWLVYATFGHSAAELDNPVAPAEDERDNILNVIRHCHFAGHGVYEFLSDLSRGTGEPQTAPRAEMTTADLAPGAEKDFEAAVRSLPLDGETLWYRMIAGGSTPRYIRLRPRAKVSDLLTVAPLPTAKVNKLTIEILTLRPAMSYNLHP